MDFDGFYAASFDVSYLDVKDFGLMGWRRARRQHSLGNPHIQSLFRRPGRWVDQEEDGGVEERKWGRAHSQAETRASLVKTGDKVEDRTRCN